MRRHYKTICSDVYDLTKPIGGSCPDVAYYLRRFEGFRGRILEAGVGTGRLLIPLLRAGLSVEGLDDSSEMLAYCRGHCEAEGLSAPLHHGSLEALLLPGRYEAIVMTFGSFGLLAGPGEAESALGGLARHLTTGGRLFLDIQVPDLRPQEAGARKLLRVVPCPDGSTILVEGATTYDMIEQAERTILFYEKWKDGAVIARELQDLPLRWYGRRELSSLLTAAGFTGVTACADYVEGTAPAAARDWLCFTAQLGASSA